MNMFQGKLWKEDSTQPAKTDEESNLSENIT